MLRNGLYCMVWYGMVWYGMVWYAMLWYGRANTMSMWSRHCSRPAPAVYGYRRGGGCGGSGGEGEGDGEGGGEVVLEVLKEAEDIRDALRFWHGPGPARL